MNRKILLLLVVFGLAIFLSACGKKEQPVDVDEFNTAGVPETGLVIDVTELNGQTATTTPGDVIYLKLSGEADSGNQWSVISPTTGGYIMLTDHQLIGIADPTILDGQFTDEWWLKIEKVGTFDLQFDYGTFGSEVIESFELEIVSL